MKKTKLEKVLEYLINDDEENAKALLHDVFIEKAREIHESLIDEDDDLEDEDLGDMDDMDVEDGESEEDYMDDEDMEGGDEEAGAELGDELGGDEAEESVEERIEDLESELEALKAEFAELAAVEDEEHGDDYDAPMGDDEDEGDVDEMMMSDDDYEMDEMKDYDHKMKKKKKYKKDDYEMEEDGDGGVYPAKSAGRRSRDEEYDGHHKAGGGDADGVYEGSNLEWDDEDFLALDESAVDDLQDVNVKMTHDEVGDGAKVTPNNDSPIPQRDAGDRAGNAIAWEVQGSEHDGFDREKAPADVGGTGSKNPINTRGKGAAGQSKVSKEGDASAELNSGEGFGAEGTDSVLGSREMRGKKRP